MAIRVSMSFFWVKEITMTALLLKFYIHYDQNYNTALKLDLLYPKVEFSFGLPLKNEIKLFPAKIWIFKIDILFERDN